MQFESFHWLSHHGIWAIIPWSTKMASVCVIFWAFLFLLWPSFLFLGGVFNKTTRRSKIVSRATGRYAATSFDQLLVCPMSSFVGVVYFFLSPKAIARFRVFQKNVMKKVITHNSNTVNVLSSFFRCSRLSLTTSCRFQAPHVIMLRY